jgi:acetyl/propionyl-CoA carboxylase alpha subunit
MIAKLITFGSTREEARLRMIRAIHDYQISGIETTLSFGDFVMKHPAFIEGDFDTKFIEKYFQADMLTKNIDETASVAAFSAGNLFFQQIGSHQEVKNTLPTNWQLKRKN